MRKLIQPSEYAGSISAPSSKSYLQRAIAIAVLAEGETIIENADFCNDSLAILEIARQLGARISILNKTIKICAGKEIQCNKLSAGESGLGVRIFIPIAALFENQIILTGEGSLLKRPIDMIEKPLRSLGVEISSNNGFLPVSVCGKLKGGNATVDGSISSQALTGLLIALPKALNDSILTVKNLKSIPYIDMTIEIIAHFGVEIKHENYQQFFIAGNQKYFSKTYIVEGDWSSAAFHLVAAAIAGKVEVSGLNILSKQADRAVLQAIEQAGANVYLSKNLVGIKKNKLTKFEFDATNCPDLFPPLVALAAACKGKSTIKGCNRLLFKESNRAATLKTEMEKLGISIEIENDLMIITGGKIKGGIVNSNNDHRIAMAASVIGLIAESAVEIEQVEAVNKSYPNFFNDFDKCTKKTTISV